METNTNDDVGDQRLPSYEDSSPPVRERFLTELAELQAGLTFMQERANERDDQGLALKTAMYHSDATYLALLIDNPISHLDQVRSFWAATEGTQEWRMKDYHEIAEAGLIAFCDRIDPQGTLQRPEPVRAPKEDSDCLPCLMGIFTGLSTTVKTALSEPTTNQYFTEAELGQDHLASILKVDDDPDLEADIKSLVVRAAILDRLETALISAFSSEDLDRGGH